ncbi:MAG: glycoside hydrolase family 43 protein [Bacteroidales bacterium]|nr:glycoside hydrolase family 43 protein [Bacteroidales bacterium]
MKSLFYSLLFAVIPFILTAQDVYHNPVIPGFHPDPSVCRVDSNYYLVTSSFEFFPGVPVFHSRDLVHWDLIGYCLTQKNQLNLEKAPPSAGIYAPTLRYHMGTFYMITTNVSGGGNFIVTASDPRGPWSDPVWIDQSGIDPSLFFDDDGKVYYTGNTPWDGSEQGIYQFEIDPSTGKKLSPVRLIWKGTGGRYPEGPHLYKINGWYYLMIAEGGTEYGHMETIARSKSPWGPFEPCPRNPILTHRNANGQSIPIQGTGHADLIQAHDGSWWIVFLAFRPVQGNWHHLGRETFLAPVVWDEYGWPVAGINGTVLPEMKVKTLKQTPEKNNAFMDDFNNKSLSLEWNYLRNPDYSCYSLTERDGWLCLKGNRFTLDSVASPAFIGIRQQHFSFTATAKMDFEPKRNGEEAGITAFMNNRFHYRLCAEMKEDRKKYIVLNHRLGSYSYEVSRMPYSGSVAWLRITASPESYTFSFSSDGKKFTIIGTGDTRFLSSEVAGGFTGVFIGLYATGKGKPSSVPAYFDAFEYVPGDK